MNDKMNSRAICSLLSWDSDFWGFPTARLNAETLTLESTKQSLDWCEKHRIRCLYFLAAASHAETLRLASEAGFRFVGIRMDMEFCLNNPTHAKEEAHLVRNASAGDLPKLREITACAYNETRFVKDGFFDAALCEKLYVLWVERDFSQNKVLVAVDSENQVLGYITFDEHAQGVIRMGLLAVEKHSRGRGIGRSLVSALVAKSAKKNAPQTIFASTQSSNIPTIRLFESVGFRTKSANVWYHKWF